MAREYVPINGNMVVRVQKQKASEGGILLPENASSTRDRLRRGTIEAVSIPWVTEHGVALESNLDVGDRVVFTVHADVLEDDKESTVYAVNDAEIIAIEKEVAK